MRSVFIVFKRKKILHYYHLPVFLSAFDIFLFHIFSIFLLFVLFIDSSIYWSDFIIKI